MICGEWMSLFVLSITWKSAKISSLLILAWVNLWKCIYQPKTRQLKMLGVATMICYHLHSCWDGTCMLQLFLVSDIFNCHCKECLRGRGCAAADQLTFQTRRLPSLNIWNCLSHKHFLCISVKSLIISAPLTICGYPNFPDKLVHFQGKYPFFTKNVVYGSMDRTTCPTPVQFFKLPGAPGVVTIPVKK